MRDPGDYFPGDPPWAEVFVALGLLSSAGVLALAALLWVASRWYAVLAMPATTLLRAAFIALALTCVAALPILGRHMGAWAGLKRALVARVADLARYHSDNPELSCRGVHQRLYQQNPPAWQYRFGAGDEPVTLFVRSTIEGCRVAVDFGNGGVAVFDPTTMWVTYSD
jgi:hypothetical protein